MMLIIIIIIIIIITSNRGNWNHLLTIQKIPHQHDGNAGNQGTTNKKQPYRALDTDFGEY